MAVDARPSAAVYVPMAVDVSPDARVNVPIATEKSPDAIVLPPMAVDESPIAIVSTPVAVEMSVSEADNVSDLDNDASCGLCDGAAKSSKTTKAEEKYPDATSSAITTERGENGSM